MSVKKLLFKQIPDTNEYYICDTTGEVLGTIKSDKQLLKMSVIEKNESQTESESDNDVYVNFKNFKKNVLLFKNLQNWGKSNLYVEERLAKLDISKTSWQVLSFLKANVAFKSGLVKKNKIANMTRKDIKGALELSDYGIENAINTLNDVEIIKFVSINGRDKIYLNPYVFYKGNYITVELKKLFENSLWKKYTDFKDNERNKKYESKSDSSYPESGTDSVPGGEDMLQQINDQ